MIIIKTIGGTSTNKLYLVMPNGSVSLLSFLGRMPTRRRGFNMMLLHLGSMPLFRYLGIRIENLIVIVC